MTSSAFSLLASERLALPRAPNAASASIESDLEVGSHRAPSAPNASPSVVARQRRDQRWRRALLALTIVAIGLRSGTMLWLNTPGVYGGDESAYVELAKQLLRTGHYSIPEVHEPLVQGGQPGDPTTYRTPGLPFFLAFHYWLFGENDIVPKITLVILSGLTCTMIAWLGRRLFSSPCGLVAGFLWAFWPTALLSGYRANALLAENLALFLFVAGLLCLIAQNRRASPLLSAAAGLLIGAAILTRAYLLLAVPLLMLRLLVGSGSPGLRLKAVGLMVLGLFVPLAPWVARNWIVFGKPLLSTQAEHLYLGNNPWARGSLCGDIWSQGTRAPQFKVLEKRHPEIWETSETDRAAIWIEEGVRCVRDNLRHPGHFLWLEGRKALLFLLPLQDWSFGWYRYHYAYLLATFLAPLGLIVACRQGSIASLSWPLIPIVVGFGLCLLFAANDRFRYVIEPFVLVIGAYGITEAIRSRSRRPTTFDSTAPADPAMA